MKLLALVVAGLDVVDADGELIDGSRVWVSFDVSPQDDGALAAWEPDVFQDEPMLHYEIRAPFGASARLLDHDHYPSIFVSEVAQDEVAHGRSVAREELLHSGNQWSGVALRDLRWGQTVDVQDADLVTLE